MKKQILTIYVPPELIQKAEKFAKTLQPKVSKSALYEYLIQEGLNRISESTPS